MFKTNVAECAHCKKTYAQTEFTPEMKNSLDRENQTNPAKRPIWQGCGCLVLSVVFAVLFSFSLYGVYMRSGTLDAAKTEKDLRKELLKADMAKMTSFIQRDTDFLSFALKECIDYNIVGGLDTENIEYFTKLNNGKLLVLLHIDNIKKIKPEFRKDIISVVEHCLYQMDEVKNSNEFYIGVEGRWNTVLVKTPIDSALGGRFADQYKLLPFYDEQVLSETTTENDTLLVQ